MKTEKTYSIHLWDVLYAVIDNMTLEEFLLDEVLKHLPAGTGITDAEIHVYRNCFLITVTVD